MIIPNYFVITMYLYTSKRISEVRNGVIPSPPDLHKNKTIT